MNYFVRSLKSFVFFFSQVLYDHLRKAYSFVLQDYSFVESADYIKMKDEGLKRFGKDIADFVNY